MAHPGAIKGQTKKRIKGVAIRVKKTQLIFRHVSKRITTYNVTDMGLILEGSLKIGAHYTVTQKYL